MFDIVGVDYTVPVLVKVRPNPKTRYYEGIHCDICVLLCEDRAYRACIGSKHGGVHRSITPFHSKPWKPTVIWSDHGTTFLNDSKAQDTVTDYCSLEGIP